MILQRCLGQVVEGLRGSLSYNCLAERALNVCACWVLSVPGPSLGPGSRGDKAKTPLKAHPLET